MDSHVVTLRVPKESLSKFPERRDLEDTSRRGRKRCRRVIEDDSDVELDSSKETGDTNVRTVLSTLNVSKDSDTTNMGDANMDDAGIGDTNKGDASTTNVDTGAPNMDNTNIGDTGVEDTGMGNVGSGNMGTSDTDTGAANMGNTNMGDIGTDNSAGGDNNYVSNGDVSVAATDSDRNSPQMDNRSDAGSEESNAHSRGSSDARVDDDAKVDSKANAGMITTDVIYEDLTYKIADVMDVDHGAIAPKDAVHIPARSHRKSRTGFPRPKTGPLSHPAIWTSYLHFCKAFQYGPPEIHNLKGRKCLGGFLAIIHSMAVQHPELPLPTLAEFGATVKRCSTLRLKTVHPQPKNTVFDVISAAKVTGSANMIGDPSWDIDAFVDDTHYFLQDHLALLLYMWGRDRKINLTLATWTNGKPWAYKVWDRDADFASTTIVWIHHNGNDLYYGLGPLGSTVHVQHMDFTDEEIENYWNLVKGAGSFTFDDFRARFYPEEDTGARHNFGAGPVCFAQPVTAAEHVPAAAPAPAVESAPAEPVVAAELAPVAEPVQAEAIVLDEQPVSPGLGMPATAILTGPPAAEETGATEAPVAGEPVSGDQPMSGMD